MYIGKISESELETLVLCEDSPRCGYLVMRARYLQSLIWPDLRLKHFLKVLKHRREIHPHKIPLQPRHGWFYALRQIN